MDAVQAIWRDLSDDLLRFILTRMRDDAAAKDVLQETFIKIHQRLPDLREAERLAPWVYTIARRAIADHRRRTRPTEVFDEASAEDGGAEEVSAGNLNQEVAAWLRPMLGALSNEYRIALELTEFEGLTQAELAARLGISLSGAKSRVQRGRLRLKEILERCCRLEQDARGNIIGYESRGGCCNAGSACDPTRPKQ